MVPLESWQQRWIFKPEATFLVFEQISSGSRKLHQGNGSIQFCPGRNMPPQEKLPNLPIMNIVEQHPNIDVQTMFFADFPIAQRSILAKEASMMQRNVAIVVAQSAFAGNGFFSTDYCSRKAHMCAREQVLQPLCLP